jgi:uncharacterized phage protein (TIGR02216 family)
LPERFGRLSATDLLVVLAALLEGGGEDPRCLSPRPSRSRKRSRRSPRPWRPAHEAPLARGPAPGDPGPGHPPEAFWRLSLAEWRALTEAPAAPVLNRAALDALIARFPDDPIP